MLCEIRGAGRLPAWLEPHRKKISYLVHWLLWGGWDFDDPKLHNVRVRFSDTGVVLVATASREEPRNANTLNRLQRIEFWKVVRKWAALEKGARDKSKKSERSNRNVNCVNNSGTTIRSNNSRSRQGGWA